MPRAALLLLLFSTATAALADLGPVRELTGLGSIRDAAFSGREYAVVASKTWSEGGVTVQSINLQWVDESGRAGRMLEVARMPGLALKNVAVAASDEVALVGWTECGFFTQRYSCRRGLVWVEGDRVGAPQMTDQVGEAFDVHFDGEWFVVASVKSVTDYEAGYPVDVIRMDPRTQGVVSTSTVRLKWPVALAMATTRDRDLLAWHTMYGCEFMDACANPRAAVAVGPREGPMATTEFSKSSAYARVAAGRDDFAVAVEQIWFRFFELKRIDRNGAIAMRRMQGYRPAIAVKDERAWIAWSDGDGATFLSTVAIEEIRGPLVQPDPPAHRITTARGYGLPHLVTGRSTLLVAWWGDGGNVRYRLVDPSNLPSLPAAPSGLRIASTGVSSVGRYESATVTWDARADVRRYHVFAMAEDEQGPFGGIVEGGNSGVLASFVPGRTYLIQVRAETDAGLSEPATLVYTPPGMQRRRSVR